jgi:hypothetical protein
LNVFEFSFDNIVLSLMCSMRPAEDEHGIRIVTLLLRTLEVFLHDPAPSSGGAARY